MYGPGAAPPRRESDGAAITLRVLFPALSVLTCGLLSCAPLFRIAALRRRPLDWALAIASLPVSITLFGIIGSLPEADPRTDVALALLLLLAIGSAVYFLVYDIRRPRAALRRARTPGRPRRPPTDTRGRSSPGPPHRRRRTRRWARPHSCRRLHPRPPPPRRPRRRRTRPRRRTASTRSAPSWTS